MAKSATKSAAVVSFFRANTAIMANNRRRSTANLADFENLPVGEYPCRLETVGRASATQWGKMVVKSVVGGNILRFHFGGEVYDSKGFLVAKPKVAVATAVKTAKPHKLFKTAKKATSKPKAVATTAYKLEGYNKQFSGKFALAQHYRKNTPKAIAGGKLPQILALKDGQWVQDGFFTI